MKITAMPILSHLKRKRQTDKGKAPVNAVSVPQEAREQTQMPSAEARISATGEPGPSSWHGRPLSLEMVRTVPCVTFEVTVRCEALRIAELPVAAVDTPGMPAALSNDVEKERSKSHDCLALEAVESPDETRRRRQRHPIRRRRRQSTAYYHDPAHSSSKYESASTTHQHLGGRAHWAKTRGRTRSSRALLPAGVHRVSSSPPRESATRGRARPRACWNAPPSRERRVARSTSSGRQGRAFLMGGAIDEQMVMGGGGALAGRVT
ncbi:hypothetical protein LTR53_010614 [Teratosphaeriaceae sp. CCFEE 6253]|nr:hypothetical protein LTR53_010614 [Teratosphaeriaceae sp. CCFEE 6253]